MLGIESGIVLSTGDCVASFTKAYSGSYGGNNTDPDLAKLVIGNSGDAAVLEFQLVATGSLLNFQYVFGSREFDQPEQYNDVFGLL